MRLGFFPFPFFTGIALRLNPTKSTESFQIFPNTLFCSLKNKYQKEEKKKKKKDNLPKLKLPFPFRCSAIPKTEIVTQPVNLHYKTCSLFSKITAFG